MKVKSSILALVLLATAALFGQTKGSVDYTANSVTFPIFGLNAAPVSGASIAIVGAPGQATWCYWAVANYQIGSVVSALGCVSNAANTLSSSNYVSIIPYSYPGGVSSIDILASQLYVQPTGTGNYAVATGLTSGGTNQQSNTLTSYTVPSFNPESYNLVLRNEVVGSASAHLLLRNAFNGTLIADLSNAGSGNLPSGCSSGQLPSWNGSTWVCTSVGTGTVTNVATGTGLTGGPITGTGTLSLSSTYQLPQSCSSNQVPSWNGSAWACATSGAGTVTSVGSGTGLSGGPITGSGSLAIAAAYQLPQSCSSNQIPSWNGSTWVCAANGSFTAAGDLSGSASTQEVIGILSKTLPSLATGCLEYNGSAWVFTSCTGSGFPTGTQGNDAAVASGGSTGQTIPNTYHSDTFSSGTTSLAAVLASGLAATPTPFWNSLDPGNAISVTATTSFGSQSQNVAVLDRGAATTVNLAAYSTGTVATQNAASGSCTANCVIGSGTSWPVGSNNTNGPLEGNYMSINGSGYIYQIAEVYSSTLIQLTAAPGTNAGGTSYTIATDAIEEGQFGGWRCNSKGSGSGNGCTIKNSSGSVSSSLFSNLIHDGTQSDFTLQGMAFAPSGTSTIACGILCLTAIEGKGVISDVAVQGIANTPNITIADGSAIGDTGNLLLQNIASYGSDLPGVIDLNIISGAGTGTGSNIEIDQFSSGDGLMTGGCASGNGCQINIDGSNNGLATGQVSHSIANLLINDLYIEGETQKTGTVNTSGTAVTYVSGSNFATNWTGHIQINSVEYTISSCASTTACTLTTSAGTQSGVNYVYGQLPDASFVDVTNARDVDFNALGLNAGPAVTNGILLNHSSANLLGRVQVNGRDIGSRVSTCNVDNLVTSYCAGADPDIDYTYVGDQGEKIVEGNQTTAQKAVAGVFNTNSTNNNASTAFMAGALGTSTGGTAALFFDVNGTGDLVDFYSGGSVSGSAYTAGTKEASINATGGYTINGCASGTYVKADGTGCGTPSGTTGENVVSFSSTPTFSTSYAANIITLTGNVTSSTLAAGSAGQPMTITICQNGTGSFTFAWPSNMHGTMTIGSTASKCNSQSFTYSVNQTAWIATSTGVINE